MTLLGVEIQVKFMSKSFPFKDYKILINNTCKIRKTYIGKSQSLKRKKTDFKNLDLLKLKKFIQKINI